ncbi:MAG: hypothetical protein H6Q17_2076 [Bacteroidetes bacterium]|nr:hypothetical protein [Bacteroidota bacterium]
MIVPVSKIITETLFRNQMYQKSDTNNNSIINFATVDLNSRKAIQSTFFYF